MAYRLQLREGVSTHPVFHVSLLKKSIGPENSPNEDIPLPLEDAVVNMEPLVVLEKRVIYRDSLPLTQVLVQWTQLHLDHTSWEYLPDFLKQFPRVAQLL